jgi:capsular polysaccharide export protein
MIDKRGLHFDPNRPSDLEHLLATHPLSDLDLLSLAEQSIDRLKRAHLTKYSAVDPTLAPPCSDYVLVIDQTKGDASVAASQANQSTFDEMLETAQRENPDRQILIKSHPEDRLGLRKGYYDARHLSDHVALMNTAISPWVLLDNAHSVYTVSSQLGFEAVLAGHRPIVFGGPFYAGWGLTQDHRAFPRRGRTLTAVQLFAAAMMIFPVWYDPYRDTLCDLDAVIDTLDAESRAWRDDRRGWIMHGISRWKRPHMMAFFGRHANVTFDKVRPIGTTPRHMHWASRSHDTVPGRTITHVEDGFLRSNGLGANLVPPLSLVLDDKGIYYDPTQTSTLEDIINATDQLPAHALKRTNALIEKITGGRLSKYNIGDTFPSVPTDRHRVLVPGQVADDASLKFGGGTIQTNLDLLKAARAHYPDAFLIYKPHPDVEAGLRKGNIPNAHLETIADLTLLKTDAIAAIENADEIFTMTSLLGFEALLRGKSVTCVGTPFYAGWGLTNDLVQTPERRKAKPTLQGLVHAALIDYPRYHDPVTNRPCSIEIAIDRLTKGHASKAGATTRIAAKLQGRLAPYTTFWRRQ